jgi:hypothetical protein
VVSAQLEDSLRQEIESYIEGRLSGVKQEIAELQSRLNESLSQLLDRQGEVQLDGSIAASIMEHLRAAHEEGIDLAAAESSRAKASSEMAILKAAITEIDEQRSQAEVLKALVHRVASFAPRVAFFVVKSEQVTGWRGRGFEGTVGDNAIQQISFLVSADTVIGDVARSRTTWSGGPHSHSEDHVILNRLGEETPQRIVAVPFVVRGRTVAVLYADSAGLDSEAINLEALETLVRVSAMAVELLSTRTVAVKRPAAVEEAPTPQAFTPAYVPAREYGESSPEVVAEPAAAVEEEALPAAEEHQVEPSSVPSMSPASAEPISAPLGTRRRYGMDAELPVSVSSDEERRLHNDARRFARLLISEIKLYNEQKVKDGRSEHDLYERLREYIDRSRDMYDKRVKPEVAKKYDYFHHELVGTLAEGDADKLGTAYPGAAVSA